LASQAAIEQETQGVKDMSRVNFQKKVLMMGYILNAMVSIVIPLFSLMVLHFSPYASVIFLTDLFGVGILASLSVSIFSKNQHLYLLNIFSGVIFLSTFIQSSFPASFMHLIFVVYALLTVILFMVDLKKDRVSTTIFSSVRQ